MNNPTMEQMSGETKGSPKLLLNDIQYNGQTNMFYLVDRKGGMVENAETGKKKFNKTELGTEAKVIFLRIRRKLRQFRKNDKPFSTNEHNTKFDMLTMFGDAKIIKASNDELRERYPLLKTNQVVYCLLVHPLAEQKEPELVRLNVKGSSLGSDAKAKNVHTFYSYVSSFKDGGADEHFYEHVTKLFGVEEDGPNGSYYSMTFEKGNEIKNDPVMLSVEKNMRIVYEFIQASDEYYKTKTADDINKEKKDDDDEDIDTIEYPQDDANPDEIPF